MQILQHAALEIFGIIAEQGDNVSIGRGAAGGSHQGVEEMTRHASEGSTGIESVAAISEENSAAAEEGSASTEEMNSQISLMAGSARELAVLAKTLRSAVSRFTLDDNAGDGQSAPAIESGVGATRMLPAPNGSAEPTAAEAGAKV